MRCFMKTRSTILFWLLVISRCSYAGSLDVWTSRDSGTTNDLNDITYAAPLFVAVGDKGTILTSTNAADWVSQNSGTSDNLYGLTYGNGLFIAVGQIVEDGQWAVLTSTDGVTWSDHFSLPLITLYGVAYGNGLFVAVGVNGLMGISTDGTNWAVQSSGITLPFLDVTYANGLFVAVAAGNILTSTDGTNWLRASTVGQVYGLNGVAFGQSKFVAVGGSAPTAFGGFITTSLDGLTWNPQNSGVTRKDFYDVAWGNGSFVAVGGTGFGKSHSPNCIIVSSSDAVSWVNRLADATSSLNGVVYGNGSFVAVGFEGAILQSGPIFTLTGASPPKNGGFELDLTGKIGRSYRIQTSTDPAATNWTDWVDFTNTTETTEFLDTDATNSPRRFYRAVSP